MTAATAVRKRYHRALLAAELIVIAIVAVTLLIIVTRGPSAPNRPFAADSVWNERVPAQVRLSPESSTYVADLEHQVQEVGPWINTTSYSVPVYTVGSGVPLVPVKLDQSGSGSVGELARAFARGVPIPAGARPAAGTDKSLVIWQPSSNTLWEFWLAHAIDGVWHAKWGGKMTDVSSNPGYFDHPADWGASATSLSLLGGLMRISELRSGHIDHALALAVPEAQAGHFVYPAQRDDGRESSPTAIPEGTRFRLDPNLNVKALHLPPITQEIALAAQRYGMIVRDQSGAVSLYAEDPTRTGSDPYAGPHGLFDGLAPNVILRAFPWSHLHVVSPSWGRR